MTGFFSSSLSDFLGIMFRLLANECNAENLLGIITAGTLSRRLCVAQKLTSVNPSLSLPKIFMYVY